MSANFPSVQYADGSLTITLSPSRPIGNWTIQYREFKNVGGGQPLILASGQGSGLIETNLIEKWCGSGTGGGASGITVTDSGLGVIRVALPASETSGRDCGAYAYEVFRVDSGYLRQLDQGYRMITP